MDGFRVETCYVGATTVTAAAGEIDSYNADRFRQELLAAIAGSDSAVVVDLLQVETLDSSALGALLDAHAQAEKSGIRMTLVFDDPVIDRTMEISGLAEIFSRARSVAQATRGR